MYFFPPSLLHKCRPEGSEWVDLTKVISTFPGKYAQSKRDIKGVMYACNGAVIMIKFEV